MSCYDIERHQVTAQSSSMSTSPCNNKKTIKDFSFTVDGNIGHSLFAHKKKNSLNRRFHWYCLNPLEVVWLVWVVYHLQQSEWNVPNG